VNATTVETAPSAQLSRCNFWKGLAIKMEQWTLLSREMQSQSFLHWLP
jgi:hypothetical protein